MDPHAVVSRAYDVLRTAVGPVAGVDLGSAINAHLSALLAIPTFNMSIPSAGTLPFTLRRGILAANVIPTNDDYVIKLGTVVCALCDKASQRDTNALHAKIVAAARHVLRLHPGSRVVVVRGKYCYGCAELCVVLISVYLAIQARTSARVAPAAPSGPFTADVLLAVMRHLRGSDRRAAAATCRAWHQVAVDPVLADASGDAVDLLRSRFALLEGAPWEWFPGRHALVVAWALTNHWLDPNGPAQGRSGRQ
jgi:hypothetical protein